MRKQIGIVGSLSGDTFGVGVSYMQFLSQFGDVHIITPDSPLMSLDLLILKGGGDIAPVNYHEKPQYKLWNSNPFLERFDREVLPHYIANKTPIFGICRGMQSLNVNFGGTMKQHLWGHPENGKDRSELVHSVYGNGVMSFKVNSMHHQAVDKISDCFNIILKSKECVEAIRHKTLPISGVQWHPEEINDKYSIAEIQRLLGVDKLS